MMKTFLLSLIFCSSLYAQEQIVPLPTSVPTLDDIVKEFRDTLTLKLDEIGKNFISTVNGKIISYSSGEPTRCNGQTTVEGQPLASVQYHADKKANELFEKTIYTGCNRSISLIEDMVTKGNDLKPIEYEDFIRGKRSFDLRSNEFYKHYRLSNSDNEEIFKVITEKNSNGKRSELYFLNAKFLTINYEYQKDQTRLTFKFEGYTGKYTRQYASWDFNVNFEYLVTTVVSKKTDNIIQTSFFSGRMLRFSQKDFLSRVELYLFNGPIKSIRDILEYHNYYFPTTAVVKTVGQNERLLEELRIAYNRLQNNSEISLVKKQIQEYIDVVQLGQLVDKRPKP